MQCGVAWNIWSEQEVRPFTSFVQRSLAPLARRLVAKPAEREKWVARIARYAVMCGKEAQVLAMAAALEAGLTRYGTLEQRSSTRACRRVCDTRADPHWGVGASLLDRSASLKCYQGCEGFEGGTVERFIHRRRQEGIPLQEMRALAALARREVARARHP